MRRKIAIIMVVGWMALIFFMSAQDADESSQMSLRVGHVVGEWFVPGYGEWTPERQDEFARSIELFVRKSAHAADYAVLAALIANLLRCGAVRRSSDGGLRGHGRGASAICAGAHRKGDGCAD